MVECPHCVLQLLIQVTGLGRGHPLTQLKEQVSLVLAAAANHVTWYFILDGNYVCNLSSLLPCHE